MTYAFHFDSAHCTGCKACQAACKDKNDLAVGVLWRRVYEINGGTWTHTGESWTNTVFAYNLSMSCNHCTHPKCAGVCPVNAYFIREDGIVQLDSGKCIGCGYCAWACPYAAPQYDSRSGTMTKCDFCSDALDAGLPPACVAACPLRVLDVIDVNGKTMAESSAIPLWISPPMEHPYPLPAYSHTAPHLRIQPHPSMCVTEEKVVANHEEVSPRRSTWDQLPLVVFTLLAQMAVGGFWVMHWIFNPLWDQIGSFSDFAVLLPSLLIGLSLGLGVFASFAHLGNRWNAWRVFSHLRKSWLSREILFAILFGITWFVSTLGLSASGAFFHPALPGLSWLTSLLGLGLIYSMSQVYRLPSVPIWDTWRTNVSFVITSLLLGLIWMTSVFTIESQVSGILVPVAQTKIFLPSALLLLCQLALNVKSHSPNAIAHLRVVLIYIGLVGSLTLLLIPTFTGVGTILLLFIIVLGEETMGRWLFYGYQKQTLLK